MFAQLAGYATPKIGGRCTKLVEPDSFDKVVKFRCGDFVHPYSHSHSPMMMNGEKNEQLLEKWKMGEKVESKQMRPTAENHGPSK